MDRSVNGSKRAATRGRPFIRISAGRRDAARLQIVRGLVERGGDAASP
jgi:hypothetical protein